MRKLKLQMLMSIDGFVGGRDGNLDWVNLNWDGDLRQYLVQNLDNVDCILIVMGRTTQMSFIPYYASVAEKPSDPFHEYGKKVTDTPKIVLSNTLTHSEWPLTKVINGDFIEETKKLKEQNGGDIIVYGGVMFASTLIKNHLVDEIHLLINPVALGSGLPIFADIESKQEMDLVKSKAFDCGIVWIQYTPRKIQS
ncbi:MAG: deaminase [Chloroflexi bacterium HGW-Chloroflexi-10]|nr:MAG: deaminase [Chloroflexi bacterium HGW-Chloroflexi-10]